MTTRFRWCTRAGLLAVLSCASAVAHAHIVLVSPPSRYGKELLKDGPCGDPDNGPGQEEPVVYRAGSTITVEFDEFIDHDGHFRLSISVDGDQDFADPTDYDDFYVNDAVLLDNIADTSSGLRQVELKLPDMTCERCTLQLLQMMVTGQPFDPDEALYYQCADIILRDDSDTSDDGDTNSNTGSDTGNDNSDDTGSDSDTSATETPDEQSSETATSTFDTSNTDDTETEEDQSTPSESSETASGDATDTDENHGDTASDTETDDESGDDGQDLPKKGCHLVQTPYACASAAWLVAALWGRRRLRSRRK